MTEPAPLDIPQDGKLADNITHFARALRKAGLKIGPGRVVDAIRAVEAAGFSARADFYWTLHACFVSRPAERVVFQQVFRLFWRDPRYLEHMMSLLLPALHGAQDDRRAAAAERRAAEALLDGVLPDVPEPPPRRDGDETELEIDMSRTTSPEERLRRLDFEQMSVAEIAAARRMIAHLSLPVPPMPSRRTVGDPLGSRPDWRQTLRQSLRQGGEISGLARKRRRQRWPNLVALCDISGSMSQYSRMVLHFLHAVANDKGEGWAKVHAFTFGTRLTNITRHLRTRDVDQALAAAGAEAQDWEGGTRIAASLHAFNRDWSRRVMGQGATVLLISDGLDRDDAGNLGREMERLHLSARRLVWVNPLLRWDGFAPKAAGVREMLPHVDALCAGHSVSTLEDLGAALGDTGSRGVRDRMLASMGGQGERTQA